MNKENKDYNLKYQISKHSKSKIKLVFCFEFEKSKKVKSYQNKVKKIANFKSGLLQSKTCQKIIVKNVSKESVPSGPLDLSLPSKVFRQNRPRDAPSSSLQTPSNLFSSHNLNSSLPSNYELPRWSEFFHPGGGCHQPPA